MPKKENQLQTSGVSAINIMAQREKLYNSFFNRMEHDRTSHSSGSGGSLDKIDGYTQEIYSSINSAKSSFVAVGYYLYKVYLERIGYAACEKYLNYEYGWTDYTAFLAYAEKLFDFGKSSVFNYIGVFLRYCKLDADGNPLPELAEEFKEYGYSQLVEMQSMPKLLSPGLTVKEIRAKRAEYFAEKLEEEKQAKREKLKTEKSGYADSHYIPACDLKVGDIVFVNTACRRPVIKVEMTAKRVNYQLKPTRYAQLMYSCDLLDRILLSELPFEPGEYEIEDKPAVPESNSSLQTSGVKEEITNPEKTEFIPAAQVKPGDIYVSFTGKQKVVMVEETETKGVLEYSFHMKKIDGRFAGESCVLKFRPSDKFLRLIEDKPVAGSAAPEQPTPVQKKYSYNDFIGMDKFDLMNIVIAVSEGLPLSAAMGKALAVVAERREKRKAEIAAVSVKPENVLENQIDMNLDAVTVN